MRPIESLWQDEGGLILSAEVVTIGTLGVLGAVVGLNAAATAVDQELKEFAGAIRSLDQSYGYVGHQSCRAWTAGSYYRQPDVKLALSDLCADGATDIRAIEQHVNAHRAVPLSPAPAPVPSLETDGEAPPALPNQIPVPQLKRESDHKLSPTAEPGAKKPRKGGKKGEKSDRDDD